jgi:hypothetical protein
MINIDYSIHARLIDRLYIGDSFLALPTAVPSPPLLGDHLVLKNVDGQLIRLQITGRQWDLHADPIVLTLHLEYAPEQIAKEPPDVRLEAPHESQTG